MVNLLERRVVAEDFALFDAQQCERVEARLRVLARLVRHDRLGPALLDPALLAPEVEELGSAPTRAAAAALLEVIDGQRREAAALLPIPDPEPAELASRAAPFEDGDFVCHRPGRSLATGEAEVASRGYFDAEDRPPLAYWVELLATAAPGGADEADFVIVAWVSPGDRERARAGCSACPNGAVERLADVSPRALEQLRVCASRAVSDLRTRSDTERGRDR